MADDNELSRERQALLDEVEDWNELLARKGVATCLPMSAALRCTTVELRFQVGALKRQWLTVNHKLDGLV